jgi:hypothetical protein
MNTSSRTTLWPPRLELEPPPGCDGGGEVVDPPGEVGELPGLDAVEDEPPGPDGAPTRNSGGVENGSRPANWTTGVWVAVGVAVGVGVAEGRRIVPGAEGSSPPPPNNSLDPRNSTSKAPTAMPPYLSVRLSRSVSGIGYADPPVGPGSEPGPALVSLVYVCTVAVKVRSGTPLSALPAPGVRLTVVTIAARGKVSI